MHLVIYLARGDHNTGSTYLKCYHLSLLSPPPIATTVVVNESVEAQNTRCTYRLVDSDVLGQKSRDLLSPSGVEHHPGSPRHDQPQRARSGTLRFLNRAGDTEKKEKRCHTDAKRKNNVLHDVTGSFT